MSIVIETITRIVMIVLWIYTASKLTVVGCSSFPKYIEVTAAFMLFPLILCITYYILEWLFSTVAELLENMLQGNSAKGE